MREHAQCPLGQCAPGALNQSVLELTVWSGKLQPERQSCHQFMELMGVKHRVVIEADTVQLEPIGLGKATQLLEALRTRLAGL